jgi:hypothetical protein
LTDGGQARVKMGSVFGIELKILKKSCSKIFSNEGRFEGSRVKILEISFFVDG